MVLCGNCKEQHRDSLAVRECYAGAGRIKAEAPVPMVENKEPVWPPSEAQINYLVGLQVERNLPDGYVFKSKAELAAMDRAEVSDLIVMLKNLSRKEGKAGGNFNMPEGRYAVEDDDGVWKFYQVDKPDKGKWKGYTFIKMLIGSPGQYKKVQMQAEHRRRILNIINADPKRAMVNYGLHSGVCGRCSSPLSDPQSLAAGMGPKCRSLSGWF